MSSSLHSNAQLMLPSAPGTTRERSNPFRIVPIGSSASANPRPYVVDGLVHANACFLIYGPSGTGKSFLALDLLLSVAAGVDFQGRKTKRGGVVYVATEGLRSIEDRVQGWTIARGVEPANAFKCVGACNLLDRKTVDDLISAIMSVSGLRDDGLQMIIVDTLSSAIPGADENNQATMSAVLDNLRHIEQQTGAAVGVVHHVSRANAGEPRGSNTLVAGMDTSLFVSRDGSGPRFMKVNKQRDGETGTKMAFDLKQQAISYQDGSTGITCVAQHNPSTAVHNADGRNKSGHAGKSRELLALIEEMAPIGNSYLHAKQGEERRILERNVRIRAYSEIYADKPTLDAKRKQYVRDLDALEKSKNVRREEGAIVIVELTED